MKKKDNQNQTALPGDAGVITAVTKPVSELEAKARAEMAAAKGKLKTAKQLDKFIGIITALDEWGCSQVQDAAANRLAELRVVEQTTGAGD